MDANLLLASLVFGSLGAAMFMYGKKAARLVPMLVGVSLIVVPYFISDLLLMILVCCGLASVPWFYRNS